MRRAALIPLVPLALLAAACGEPTGGWANHAKVAADSPVGNTGEPNTGITAEALGERVARADREARSVRTEFSGKLYGVPVSGGTAVTKNGDSESRLNLDGHDVHVLVVGRTEYTRMEKGTFATLFATIRKAPGYDPELEEPGRGFVEFSKLIEGKYLKDEAITTGNGFPSFDGTLGGGPFGNDALDEAGDDVDDGTRVTLSLGDAIRVDGIEVIPLIETTEERGGDTSVTTMYVPTHGTPLPVRLTSDDDNDGDIDASIDTRYFALDEDRKVTAPPAPDTVDLDRLMEEYFGRDDVPGSPGGEDEDEGGSGNDDDTATA